MPTCCNVKATTRLPLVPRRCWGLKFQERSPGLVQTPARVQWTPGRSATAYVPCCPVAVMPSMRWPMQVAVYRYLPVQISLRQPPCRRQSLPCGQICLQPCRVRLRRRGCRQANVCWFRAVPVVSAQSRYKLRRRAASTAQLRQARLTNAHAAFSLARSLPRITAGPGLLQSAAGHLKALTASSTWWQGRILPSTSHCLPPAAGWPTSPPRKAARYRLICAQSCKSGWLSRALPCVAGHRHKSGRCGTRSCAKFGLC